MTTAFFLRTLLLLDMMIMTGLAFFYLRQRRLSWVEYCCWGLLALLVPFLGPFLVMLARPGEWRADSRGSGLPGGTRWRQFALLGPRRRKRLVRR